MPRKTAPDSTSCIILAKKSMEELTAGIGSRVQHARYGPGVIIGVKYAQYVITFINQGVMEVDKTDLLFEILYAENETVEVETVSQVETSILKILRLWGGFSEIVPLGGRNYAAATERLCHEAEGSAGGGIFPQDRNGARPGLLYI